MHCNYAAVKEFAIRLLRDGQVNGRLIGGLRRLVRDGEGWHARIQVSLAVVMARDSLQSPFYERIQAGEVRGSAARRRFLPKSVHRKMTSEIYREIIAGEHDDDARLSFAEFLTAQKNDAIAQALLHRNMATCLSSEDIRRHLKNAELVHEEELWSRFMKWRKQRAELFESFG
jgi:hypothetical protein